MSQTVAEQPTPASPPRRKSRRRCFVMTADWAFYSKMLKLFEGKPGYRLAYDRGRLEIMSPSILHDDRSHFLGDLAKILAEELGLPLKRGGSVTMRKRKKEKGIEPDNCFWIANAEKMAGVDSLDLNIHPPPDLSIEVDVTNSSLNRFGIYAAIGVPELWRLESNDLRFYALDGNRQYIEIAESLTFPGVKPSDLIGFVVESRTAGDETPIVRRFREWARQHATK